MCSLVCSQLLTRCEPWAELTSPDTEIPESVKDGDRPERPDGADWRGGHEPAVTQLVEACWAEDHASRPRFDAVADALGAAEAAASAAQQGGAAKAADLAAVAQRARLAEQELGRLQARLREFERASATSDEERKQLADEVDGLRIAAGTALSERDAALHQRDASLERLRDASVAAETLALPVHWAPLADPLQPELVALPDGPERQRAEASFRATLPAGVQVLSVQRVQNGPMWQSYAVKRQSVLLREDPAIAAARFERDCLFHGTDEGTVDKIVTMGFNRSFCGKNATMYGKGVYFARDASYSFSPQYSRPNASGEQHMFLVRVLIGEYCRGVQDAPAPSARAGSLLYDSTVGLLGGDTMANPSIYVTYHDAHAYPEYLVRFKQ